MPKEVPAPLDRQIEAPRVRGVSSAAREARKAEERPASEKTLALMPGVGDIARSLGVKVGKQPESTSSSDDDDGGSDDDDGDDDNGTDDDGSNSDDDGADTGTNDDGDGDGDGADDDADGSDDDDSEEDENLPPEAKQIRQSMQKRIDRLTAKNTDLQEQLEEAQQELESARGQSGRVQPSPDNPLADVMSERELTAAVDEARRIKQWCLRNRDGAEVEGKEGAITYTADQVAEILANAEATLDAAPQRKEWLAEHTHAQQLARDLAPEFFKKGSQEQIVLSKALDAVPAHVRAWRPDFDLIIIQALVGSQVLAQRKGGKKPEAAKPAEEKPKASAKPAPAAPGGKTAPKTSTKVLQAKERQKKLKKPGGGHMRDLTAALLDRI